MNSNKKIILGLILVMVFAFSTVSVSAMEIHFVDNIEMIKDFFTDFHKKNYPDGIFGNCNKTPTANATPQKKIGTSSGKVTQSHQSSKGQATKRIQTGK